MMLADALNVAAASVIALVGGGGKTTIMYRLARELADRGSRVLVTTTTRIWVPSPGESDANVFSTDQERLVAGVGDCLRSGRVVGVGLGVAEDGKLLGVAPEWVAALARVADHVIVEADGAAEKPFKAPADYEPVIPAATTLVVAVVGVDAVGLALRKENVHRPERIARLTGLAPGAAITAQAIAQVVLHREGMAKGIPIGARLVPFINKVDDNERLTVAREIAGFLVGVPSGRGAARVERVVIGRARSADPIVAVIPDSEAGR